MPRINPTRIEGMDVKFPGLRNRVDAMLDRHETLDTVAAMIEELTGENLAISVVSSYKQRRWLPSVQRIRDITERAAAIRAAYERFGIGPIAESVALEKLDEIAPDVLLRESRERLKIEIEKGKLQVALKNAETAAQEAQAKIKAQRQAVREATDEAERKLGKGEEITLEDINRIRERTFGLPPIAPAGGAANPAVPAALD